MPSLVETGPVRRRFLNLVNYIFAISLTITYFTENKCKFFCCMKTETDTQTDQKHITSPFAVLNVGDKDVNTEDTER